MKKKLLIFILSVLTVCVGCFSFGGCGSEKESSSEDSTSQQGSTWEDEVIEDQEHGEIELPEVERP